MVGNARRRNPLRPREPLRKALPGSFLAPPRMVGREQVLCEVVKSQSGPPTKLGSLRLYTLHTSGGASFVAENTDAHRAAEEEARRRERDEAAALQEAQQEHWRATTSGAATTDACSRLGVRCGRGHLVCARRTRLTELGASVEQYGIWTTWTCTESIILSSN